MSDPDGTYFDSPGGQAYYLIPRQHGPTVPVRHPVTRSLIYHQTFFQLASAYKVTPLSTAGPKGSFLIYESEPRDKGGGIIEFTRRSAVLPVLRTEYSVVSHSYQLESNGDIVELPTTVQCTTTFTYFHFPGPPNITLQTAVRKVKVGDRIYALGSESLSGFTVLHESESYSRWLDSNIYEKVSKTVPNTPIVSIG